MPIEYAELHCKSFYSFGQGASHVHELLALAAEYVYPALALTDTNLCGALEFARLANSLGIKPISGCELTLTDNSRLTLLARTREGYANISQLLTLANGHDRREPRLDPTYLPAHAEGTVLLTGGRDSLISCLIQQGRQSEALAQLRRYMDWYGSDRVYIELQQNFLHGDTKRNRQLVSVGQEVGTSLVATNDVLYHSPQRYKLQHALVAAAHNTTIDRALRHIRPNDQFYLKSAEQMQRLFRHCPEAIGNTLRIAESCDFNLDTDLGYCLPNADVPDGYTPQTYLERLCYEAAVRRYGSVTEQVEKRLREEFRLIELHGMAGFLLLYREIALIARKITEERGLVSPEVPLESRPPGRGRGSSVALLVGYLIGISHIDPLSWNLSLERFISEDVGTLPDIDLDFPRSIRDALIERVHQRFGPERAVLAGAIGTYRLKGVIQDLGKALGLPREQLKLLSKQGLSGDAALLGEDMRQLPDFRDRADAPGWKMLAELAPQLIGAPRSLGQHVGGMVLSSSPIPEMVPVRAGATDGRYIMDWNKDSVQDAGFAKIDILSLPVLDQIEEALDLVEKRTGARPDLSRIDPEDTAVYDMINEGKSKGVFLLQSPAQLKIAQRLRSRNLRDLAYQVALIRPGVGMQGSAVSQFIDRYRHGVEWNYDHELEARALERGWGIIVWQEQVVQLLVDVGGMSAAQADEVRRAFARPNNEHLIETHWQRFLDGARKNSVSDDVAKKVFGKVNGHYMFPESHSHAFSITAYQAAWLKRYHPTEFFVALMNNQPMGFYPIETLKQDARRFAVPFLNPCVNRSEAKCTQLGKSVLLGLRFIKDVGEAGAGTIIRERKRGGAYTNAGDLVRRTGLKPQAVESLVMAGAFDTIAPNRKQSLWEAGLHSRPGRNGQAALPASMDASVPRLADFTDAQKMATEYAVMGIYPRGHLMQFVRPTLAPEVLTCAEVERLDDGAPVLVAGWPVARQHPKGKDGTIYVTIEDETGDTQVILWADIYKRYRRELGSQVVLIAGELSRYDGTANIIVSEVRALRSGVRMPRSHDWH